MQRLIAAARSAGVDTLADMTLYDNRAMLMLARKLGFTLQRALEPPAESAQPR